MSLKDHREACEVIRHSLVYSMRCGDRFVIYVDKLTPNFKTDYNFPPELWPSELIFDFEKWREYENYMQVVKTDENHDMLLQKGKYFMHDNFQMIILGTHKPGEQSEADVKSLLECIPFSDKMAKYLVIH